MKSRHFYVCFSNQANRFARTKVPSKAACVWFVFLEFLSKHNPQNNKIYLVHLNWKLKVRRQIIQQVIYMIIYNIFTLFQRCIPAFENAAFQVQIESTNTCGEGEDEQTFCVQTGYSNRKSCDRCRLVVSTQFKSSQIEMITTCECRLQIPASATIAHHIWLICTIRAIRLGGNRKRCLRAFIRAKLI